MTDKNDGELELLRRRAYGPRPDIHLDPQAVSRLRELESRSRPVPVPLSDHDAVPPELPAVVVAQADEKSDAAADPQRTSIDWSWARELFDRLLGMRRSTALIVLSVLVVVVVAVTALTLVQRVQVDPLQVGAEQVARLPLDASYDIPEVLDASAGRADLEAFQDFYGMRTVAASGAEGWFFAAGSGDCLSVFSEVDMEFTANSFGGLIMNGCGAGDFPAIVQFGTTGNNVPDELRAAFPDAAAFQFVFDADNREIVVFMSR